ncbi:unnamed protein product [Gadus morhua 'NCC']
MWDHYSRTECRPCLGEDTPWCCSGRTTSPKPSHFPSPWSPPDHRFLPQDPPLLSKPLRPDRQSAQHKSPYPLHPKLNTQALRMDTETSTPPECVLKESPHTEGGVPPPPPHLTLLSLKIVLDSNVLFVSFARTSVSSSPSVITSSIFALNALAGCAGRRLSSPLLLLPWKMPCGRAPLEPTFF